MDTVERSRADGGSWQFALHSLNEELGQVAHDVPPCPPERVSDVKRLTCSARDAAPGMNPRLEYKYLVPNEHLSRLRGMIAPFVEVDVHAVPYGTRGYTVRSIYFDTRALDFYHEKLAGLKVRKKLRLRGYNGGWENSVVFLEIKRKRGGSVTKNRSPVEYVHIPYLFGTGDIERCIGACSDFPHAADDARRFFFYVFRQALRPVALIAYEREAYQGRFSPFLRITFDKNLRSAIYPSVDALFEEQEMRYGMSRHFILEVKFSGRFPSWLRSAIGVLDLSRQALSKYVIGVDRYDALGRRLAFARPSRF